MDSLFPSAYRTTKYEWMALFTAKRNAKKAMPRTTKTALSVSYFSSSFFESNNSVETHAPKNNGHNTNKTFHNTATRLFGGDCFSGFNTNAGVQDCN